MRKETVPYGRVIWVRGSGLAGGNDSLRMQALVMHELMHEMFNVFDDGIQQSIRATGLSEAITNKLLENCVKGTGNF